MSVLEEFKQLYENTILPEDIIIYAFSSIGQDTIKKDPSIIHKVFCEIKEVEECKDILSDYNFNGLSPYSEELDASFTGLECSGLLQTFNPSYEEYCINRTDRIIDRIGNNIKNLSTTKIAIDKMCDKLKKELLNN